MVAVSVDQSLLKKNNSVFLARRIQFKESTRIDLKQERLKKKYKPVNALLTDAPSSKLSNKTPSSMTYSGTNGVLHSATAASAQVEDVNGFRNPAKILYSKEKVQLAWPQPRPIGPGLNNLGNTCFLNSVLQCLTYTPPLANYLLSNHHSNTCKTTNFCMLCLLEKHVNRCFSHSMHEAIAPKVIVGRLRNIGKQFRIGRQEDSHEFARYLIDALQKSCLIGYDSKLDNRIKETTIIHQIFGGYFQSQVKCMKCGYESNTFETYLDVSLDIRNAESVQKALRDYTKPDLLTKSNQYKCDKCKVLVDARKQMTIYEAPNILSVHLKRFTFTGQKINRHVRFESKLELNSVMSTNKKHPELNYSLYAVLVHAGGSCHSGHYYCFVKSSNGIWYSMNDSHVSVVSLQTVLSQNAYMLFYTLDKKGASRPAAKNVPATPKANGTANGVSVAPIQKKRSRLEEDDVGAKVDRSSLIPKEKKVKVDETLAISDLSALSKEERIRIKKERKRARKLELLKQQQTASQPNDYELATTATSSTLSPTAHTIAPKTIFGAPLPTVSSASKSPLADLDEIFKTPTTKPAPSKPMSITIPTRPQSDWKITDGILKSPVLEELRLLDEKKRTKREVDETESETKRESSDDDSSQVEQDGWTVKPKSLNSSAIVVEHNEGNASKKEKLQALISRESEFRSSEVKETILNSGRHMLGSKVSTWEEPSADLAKAREDVLRSLKPKHHRPDAYDVDYDRGKIKKVKKKNVMSGAAVGAEVGNKFQKEQDVRNLYKPKFKKPKTGDKKLPKEM